ncbi:hypothetical protein F0L68_09400 [Solihabitans fulvus]|uniref:Flagellar basal body-associated protein FliL n=1 Tax=Solihabitans fulvus TaxID=1892852 RepID=A0A5B2XIP5_9PSEU|nr:hypothetical protein [Solihabitans fulvus]KAA2263697.1 hypothetical protein F0L68_09400 [Solihabitans fulvus]
MAWQDELKALDDSLASGSISGDQYRVLRDDVLARASGGAPAAPPPAGGAPARWESSNPANATPNTGSDADRTQVVSRQSEAEQTMVVSGVPTFPPRPNQPPQQQPPQQFSQYQQQQPYQQQQQQPQQQGGAPTTPPWGDPAAFQQGMSQWQSQAKQGPEVFAAGGGKKSGKWVGVLVAVIVLALIGGGVWWFGFRQSGTTTAQSSNSSSQSPSSGNNTQGFSADSLPTPQGDASPDNGQHPIDEAKRLKLITANDGKATDQFGVQTMVYKLASKNGLGLAASAFVTKDKDTAKQLAAQLVTNQKQASMVDGDRGDAPASVSVMKIVQPNQVLYRATYTSGAATIRVAASGAGTEQDVAKQFQQYLAKVLQTAPVG